MKFDLPPDSSRILGDRLREDDEFRRKFSNCWQDTFYQGLDYRTKHGMNIILSILGIPGTGKSYAGIYLGKYIGRITGVEFPDSSKNIVFTYQEFLNIVKSSKAKETIVQDEQRVLGVGFGSRSLSEEIQDIERVIRKRQNNMIYIAPTLESHLHIGILEPTGINYEQGVCRLMFYDNKEIPRGKVYTLMPNKTILENYGKRKDAFIDKMVNRNMGDQYEEMERILQNLLTDDQFQTLSNKAKRVFHIAKKYPTLPAQMHEWLADLAVVTNE